MRAGSVVINMIKSDDGVVAFGGCDQTPIHLVAATPGSKVLSHGTSFASAIVAAFGGQTLASLEGGIALNGVKVASYRLQVRIHGGSILFGGQTT